jgi:uncharacterized protein involved in outer membrane biogenesis
VQHALLAIAIALIAALAAALVAPAFVDWNDWRTAFESRATAITGVPVKIGGRIDATILPTPAFVFSDVEIGDPESATGISAGEVRGILSLGALLRGMVEAEEFVLTRPAMRLVIGEDGRLLLPAMAEKPAGARSFSIARIAVKDGSLKVEDRAKQSSLGFDGISATGELRSRLGPMRLDAALGYEGRRWTLRATSGYFGDDAASKVRFLIERADDGTALDAEGTLALAKAEPRFEGKLKLRRGGSGLPWRIEAHAQASGELIALDSLVLAFGSETAPVELTGNVQFVPRPRGRIEGTLSARQLDLDRAVGGQSGQGLLPALALVREALALIDGLPLAGRIGVSIEALVAGNAAVRDLHADLGVREGAFALERFEARLPGRGLIKAAGTGSGSEIFSGDVSLEAEDSTIFARWLTGAASTSMEESGSLRVGGRVEIKPPRFAIDKLDFALGEAKMSGRFVLTTAEGKRTRVESDLVADGIDLGLLAPLAGAARAGSDTLDLRLGFKGRGLRLLDHPLRQIDAALSRSAEGVAVERLSIDDFDGASLKARGRIAAPWERANGRIEFEIETSRAEGLAALAQALAGDDAAALTRRIASLGPVKLSGAATGDGSAAGVVIEAQGRISEIQTSLRARFDPRTESLEEARIRLEAQESGRLVSLFGLMPGPPAPGDGRLEVTVTKGRAGVLPLSARLRVPGTNLTGDGEIRSGGGRIEPRLNLRLEAVDLRPLLAAAARASGEQELPASGSARLERTGNALAFENIAVNIGNIRARGRIEVAGFERPALAGKLALERAELAGLLGLVLGRAGEGSSFWPEARLGTPPLAGATGTVEFDVGALELAGRLSATGVKFKLRLGADDAAIEDFTAELAGGKLAGNARIVRGDPLALDGRIALGQFEIERLLVPGTWRAAARGRGDLLLAFAGNGRTPAELAGKLAGQGTLALEAIEIDQLDPNALAAVLAATEGAQPPDEAGTLALLAPALAKGPLRLSKLEAPVILAAGVARTGKARANAGPVQVMAEGNLDLARLNVDAAIELESAAPEGLTAKPAAIVRWRGSLAAPERAIDAAALATAIVLSAVDRETGRLEGRPPPRKPPPASASPAGVPLPPPRPRDLGSSLTAAPPLPPAAEIPPAPRAVPLPPQR